MTQRLIHCTKFFLLLFLATPLLADPQPSAVFERFTSDEIAELIARDIEKTEQTLVNHSFDREDAPEWFISEYGDFTFGSYGTAYIHLGRPMTSADLDGLVAWLSQFERFPEIRDRKDEELFLDVDIINVNGNTDAETGWLLLNDQESASAELQVRIPVWGPFTTSYRAQVIMQREDLNLSLRMVNSSAIQFLFTRLMEPEDFIVDLEVYPYQEGVLIYVAAIAKPALENVAMTAEFFSRYGESTSDWIELYLRSLE